MTATAEQLRTAALAPPPDPALPRFDKQTGDLRVAGKTYKPLRYTRKLARASSRLAFASSRETIKAARGAQKAGDEVTDEMLDAVEETTRDIEELAFARVLILFADESGHPPKDEDLDDLTHQDAQAAVEFVTGNPTAGPTSA